MTTTSAGSPRPSSLSRQVLFGCLLPQKSTNAYYEISKSHDPTCTEG